MGGARVDEMKKKNKSKRAGRERERETAVWGGGIKRHLNAEGRETRKEKTVKELLAKGKRSRGEGRMGAAGVRDEGSQGGKNGESRRTSGWQRTETFPVNGGSEPPERKRWTNSQNTD